MVGDIYGTGIEIWAGFGPFGITEKKWADYEQLLRPLFHVFMGKKNKNSVASALKSCRNCVLLYIL